MGPAERPRAAEAAQATRRAVTEYYTNAAATLIPRYDAVDPSALFQPVWEYLPGTRARVLDIGAGTGRDATWFSTLGHEVTACDPVGALRVQHHAGLNWHKTGLPDLEGITGPFELIHMNAVWHHIDPDDRTPALARLATLLTPQGRLLMSLRQGTPPAEVPSFQQPLQTLVNQAATYGLSCQALIHTRSQQAANRASGVTWVWLVLQAG